MVEIITKRLFLEIIVWLSSDRLWLENLIGLYRMSLGHVWSLFASCLLVFLLLCPLYSQHVVGVHLPFQICNIYKLSVYASKNDQLWIGDLFRDPKDKIIDSFLQPAQFGSVVKIVILALLEDLKEIAWYL